MESSAKTLIRPPAPTMKDVARVAGVSLGTVSKVINGQNVGDSYKSKVLFAIDKLDYRMNHYARGLKLNKSFAIALIIPDVRHPFFSSFAYHIESSLYEHGYKLTLCCSDGEAAKEVEYLNHVQMNKVDGIIALTYGDIEKHIPEDIPLVAFDRQFVHRSIPRVSSDNFAGGVIAAEKLIELGCTAPAFARVHSAFPGESDRRKEGFLYVCKSHGIDPIVVETIEERLTEEEGYGRTIARLINENQLDDGTFKFDGIFCNTDLLAYNAKKRLEKLGRRVPEDVQIIGFDGIRHFNLPDMPLYVSSIVQPVHLLAEKCVELVLAEDNSAIPVLTQMPVKFEYGGTTKLEQQKGNLL